MTGKARGRRTNSGVLGKNKDDINKLFNVRTRNKIVTPTQITLPSGSTNSGIGGNYLPLSGGVMNGIIGGKAFARAISTGDLDLTSDNASNDVTEFPIIFVSPESGTTDTLDTITISNSFPAGGRILLVGVSGNTITITNNSGSGTGLKKDIIIDGGNDFSLGSTQAIELFYDIVNDAFHLIVPGFLNPATEDLDMDTFNIIDFGVISQGGTEAAAGAIRLINNVSVNWRNAANTADHSITLNGSDEFVITGTFRPSTDGTLNLGASATPWNNGYFDNTLFINNIQEEESGNDINILSDLDLATGVTVDFADTSTAGASEGFIVIKVNGVSKRVEYFAIA